MYVRTNLTIDLMAIVSLMPVASYIMENSILVRIHNVRNGL